MLKHSLTLPPPIDEDDSTSKPGFYTASAKSSRLVFTLWLAAFPVIQGDRKTRSGDPNHQPSIRGSYRWLERRRETILSDETYEPHRFRSLLINA